MGEKVIQFPTVKASEQAEPATYNRIDNNLFREIVNAGIGWLAKNPEAAINQVKEELVRFYHPEVEEGPLAAAAVTAYKLYKQRVETEKKHQKEWEEATAAAEAWFAEHPADLRHPAKVAQDILNELKPDCGGISKLTAAVAQVQEPLHKKKKEELWEKCLSSAEQHFTVNSRDKRHPGHIAEEINHRITSRISRITSRISEEEIHPYRMLTAAVAQAQKRYKEKERKELSCSGVFFLERKERIKKPGSAARRGQNNGSERAKGGGKKRGVKG